MKEKSETNTTRLNLASVPTPVNARRGVTNVTETLALSGLYASMVPAERIRHVSPTRGARALGQLLRDPTKQQKTHPSAIAIVPSRHQESVPTFEAPEVLRARERIRRRQLKASGGDAESCSGDSEVPEEDPMDQPLPVRRRVAGKQFRDGFTAPEESGETMIDLLGASEPSEVVIEAPTLPLTDAPKEPGTEQATAEKATSKKRGRAEKQVKEVNPEETAQGSEQSKAEKATSKSQGRPEREVEEVSPEETRQGTEQTTAEKASSKRRGRSEKEAEKSTGKTRGRAENEVKKATAEEATQGPEQTTAETATSKKRSRSEKEVKEVSPQETTQGNEEAPVSRRARTKQSGK